MLRDNKLYRMKTIHSEDNPRSNGLPSSQQNHQPNLTSTHPIHHHSKWNTTYHITSAMRRRHNIHPIPILLTGKQISGRSLTRRPRTQIRPSLLDKRILTILRASKSAWMTQPGKSSQPP